MLVSEVRADHHDGLDLDMQADAAQEGPVDSTADRSLGAGDQTISDNVDQAKGQLQATTIILYSAITILGVMAAATVKGYLDNSWDLSLLIVGSAMALAVAHAWATVLAEVMVGGHHPNRDLIWEEGKLALLALLPAGVVVAVLFLMDLTAASFEVDVTVSMLAAVVILSLVGYLGSDRRGLGRWTSLKWGSASALVGLVSVLVKVVFGG